MSYFINPFSYYDRENNCYVKLNESVIGDIKKYITDKAVNIKDKVEDTVKAKLDDNMRKIFSEINNYVSEKIKMYQNLNEVKTDKAAIFEKIKDIILFVLKAEFSKLTLDEMKELLLEDGFNKIKNKINEIVESLNDVVNNDKITRKEIDSVFQVIKTGLKNGKTLEEIVEEKFNTNKQALMLAPLSITRGIADKAVLAGKEAYQKLLNIYVKNGGLTPIYLSDKLEAYLINKQQAAVAVGGYVDWCTSNDNESENRYMFYRSGGLSLFYFPKDVHTYTRNEKNIKFGLRICATYNDYFESESRYFGQRQDENNKTLGKEEFINLLIDTIGEQGLEKLNENFKKAMGIQEEKDKKDEEIAEGNLSGLDKIDEVNIKEKTFKNIDFTELKSKQILNSSFIKCSFSNCNFGGLNIFNVKFVECRMDECNFIGSNLTNVVIYNNNEVVIDCNFAGAKIKKSKLQTRIKDCIGLNEETSGIEFSTGVLDRDEQMAIIYEKMKNNLYSHQHAGTDFKGIDFEGFDFTGLDVRGFSFCEAKNINSSIVNAKKVDEAMFYYEQNGKKVKAYFDEDTFKTKEQIIWLMNQKTQKEKNKKLIQAAENGNTEIVKLLLEAGADINSKNNAGWTALIWAASKGDTEVVKLLLENGADVNAKDNQGETVLIWASNKNHPEIVKLLLEAGADVNTKNEFGYTALMRAAKNDDPKIVKLLLQAGADVNVKNIHGKTALIWAANKGDTEVVKLLLEAGADVNAKDEDGKTALIEAANNGHTEIVKLLLDAEADPNAKDKYGYTTLMWAAKRDNIEVVKSLLKHGADIEAKDKDEYTALTLAALCGKTEVVNLLLDAGADIEAKDKYGDTALMKSAFNGYTELVKLLLEVGADVNAKDKNGWTALMEAAEYGRTEAVKLLLEAGADPNAKNIYGETALLWAARNGNKKVVELLKRYGAIDPKEQQNLHEMTHLMHQIDQIKNERVRLNLYKELLDIFE